MLNIQGTCNKSSFSQWFNKQSETDAAASYPLDKTGDADCYPVGKIGDANFTTTGWTAWHFPSHTLGGRNYWKIPWKMSQRFLYTASFKLKVIKYAKKHGNRAADRHFGPPPIESVIRLWRQQEEKLLQMPRWRQCEGNLHSGQR